MPRPPRLSPRPPPRQVIASYGHVRDLSPRAGSVAPDDGFRMDWQLTPRAAGAMAAVADAARGARGVVLATDPDREGEAISWHVLDELQVPGRGGGGGGGGVGWRAPGGAPAADSPVGQPPTPPLPTNTHTCAPKAPSQSAASSPPAPSTPPQRRGAVAGKPVQRVTFNEVTKKAVDAALQSPRQVRRPPPPPPLTGRASPRLRLRRRARTQARPLSAAGAALNPPHPHHPRRPSDQRRAGQRVLCAPRAGLPSGL